jgi:hypothetical protein
MHHVPLVTYQVIIGKTRLPATRDFANLGGRSKGMKNVRSYFIVMSVTFLFGVAAAGVFILRPGTVMPQTDAPLSRQDGQSLRLEVPDAVWVRGFFKHLDEYTDEQDLPSLRRVVLPKGDLEVRFWYDARPTSVNGFVFRRSSGQWSAVHLQLARQPGRSPVERTPLATPKSGWEGAWNRLISAGILALPDGSKLPCHSSVLDGGGYVVEANLDATYRTYRYDHPRSADCDEAKRIVLIEEIISEEFDIGN